MNPFVYLVTDPPLLWAVPLAMAYRTAGAGGQAGDEAVYPRTDHRGRKLMSDRDF